MTKSASVLLVASVVVLLLAVSVARQYRWVTELSDLQQEQTDRSLRLSADALVRQANHELEELWYVLHIRPGRAPEEELGDDISRWAESGRESALVAEAWWVADAAGDGSGDAPPGLEARSISLEDGTFSEPVAAATIETVIEKLSGMPQRGRRRNFSPRDGFLLDAGGGRQAYVVPQPAMRHRTWAVAVLSADATTSWLAALVAEHFGNEEDREFDVRLFRDGAYDVSDAIYVSNAEGADEPWDTPDVVSRAPYVTLAVRHREGSVAIAAANVRRANLAFTFGTVAVLLVGLGALALATRRAQRLVQRQTEFVAGVSHELRTPLSGISVLSQNLADGVVDSVDQAATYGRSIHRETRRLRDMVEGVLQLSAIRSGGFQYEFAPLDVAEAIDESLETLEPADRAVVTVTVAADTPAVDGDRRALCSAFRNLVSNAIKFGGSEPDVRVTVRPAAHRGAPGVQVDVADSGCGIDAADRRHVFDAFYRGRAAHESQTSGSGLGLSLVRIVVEAHRGTVEVSSTPGEGSVFSVHLPAIDRAALEDSPEADA